MVTNPSLNAFQQLPFQGQLDLQFPGNTVTMQVDPTQATPLIAGQAVKLSTNNFGTPSVVAVTSNSDAIIGFVVRNLKDQNYSAGNYVEITTPGSVMWMTAEAAITRGQNVQIDYTNNQINPSDGSTSVVGYAYDAAINAGDVIRVWVQKASLIGTAERSINVVATLAQINAGLVLIPGVAVKKIEVSDFTARVTGAFATGTSVILESTNVTPVVAVTFAEAGLTNGAVLVPGSANTTLGAGFGLPLGAGDGLQVVNSGAAQTGGTSITFNITYTIA